MEKTQSLVERTEISIKQLKGMILSRQRGRLLANEHPEIATEWISGKTELELGKLYCLGDSEDVSRNAIHYALKYLIPEEERITIAKKHNIEGSKKGGRNTGGRIISEQLGIYAPQNKKKLNAARKKGGEIGGRISGKNNYKNKVGIASLTHKQLVENGRKAALARGDILYEAIEKETPQGVLNERQYITQLKSLETLTWKEIAQKTNNLFKNHRNSGAIRTIYNSKWKNKFN